VREEWSRLASDLRMLAAVFGDELSDEAWEDVAVYTRAVECLDRFVDPLPSARERAAWVGGAIDVLRGNDASLPAELTSKALALRAVLARRDVLDPFCDKLHEVFVCSEALRAVRTRRKYVALTMEEGYLGADLFLVIVRRDLSPGLARFVRDVAGPANVVDNLRDATRDHADGILPLRPGVRLHLRLAAAFLRHGIPVVWNSPAPARFLAWGMRELVLPVGRDAELVAD
jgi:hypothetical protein